MQLLPSPVHAGPPTSSITVQGEGFGPGETVAITFDSAPVGKAMTGSLGSFSVQITVPASALPGSHIVQATGQSSGFSAQANSWSRLTGEWMAIFASYTL